MKVAIFDLDGTLLNTIKDLGMACNYALGQLGLPTHPLEEYPHLVGNGVNKLIERALPQGMKTAEYIAKTREYFIPYYNIHNQVYTSPYSGITQVLSELRNRQYILAVASNKYQEATYQLVTHYFPQTFDIILGEREGSKRKPDPQIVDDILGNIKSTDTPNVFYIGDSDVDMQTAKNAKLPSIACTWGFCSRETLEQYNPTYMVNKPQEILDILL